VTTDAQRGRRRDLEVDEAEYQRARALVLGKARRYGLEPVTVSDRLVVAFSDEQLARLERELAAEDPPVTVAWRRTTGYGSELAAGRQQPPRFGSDPRRGG
jgi:hypothetical protein